MGESIDVLESAIDSYTEIRPLLEGVSELQETQADARAEVISVLNALGDALVGAGDQICSLLSEVMLEYYESRGDNADAMRSYFAAASTRMNESAMGERLKRGRVCHRLHVTFDEYGQHFDAKATGAQSVKDWLRGIFGRSTSMQTTLRKLWEGEYEYLRDLRDFLRDCDDEAADLASNTSLTADQLRTKGDELIAKLKAKKREIRKASDKLEDRVETCLATLSGKPPNKSVEADAR